MKEHRDNLKKMDLEKEINTIESLTSNFLGAAKDVNKDFKLLNNYLKKHAIPYANKLIKNYGKKSDMKEIKSVIDDAKKNINKVSKLHDEIHNRFKPESKPIKISKVFKNEVEVNKTINELETFYKKIYSDEFKVVKDSEKAVTFAYSIRNDPLVKLMEDKETTEFREYLYPVVDNEYRTLNTLILVMSKIDKAIDQLY